MSTGIGRAVTAEERAAAQVHVERARAAVNAVSHYDQATVDRLCRAVAWATGNERTFGRLTRMSVDESGMGSADGVPARRWKILGILRDALRTKSVGIIEELPEKGIVKYAKPVGVIAGVLPVTNPLVTMVNMTINAVKCRDAVIFSPHPLSRKTALEITRVLRAALKKQGAPEDLVQCLAAPSIPLAQELMSICDLTIATGGPGMVKAAYSSGKPAYGVGAGNATVVVDETADVADAAKNTRISKTQNHGSGCSCDGNLIVEATVYDRFLDALQTEGGYLASEDEKRKLEAVMWDADGRRTLETVARHASVIAAKAGFRLPDGKSFIIVEEDADREGAPLFERETVTGAGHLQVQRRRLARRNGLGGVRGRGQGALARHCVLQRRPHPSSRDDGAGQPNDGASAECQRECRLVHQWDADDRQSRLRDVGREHHERKHQRQALHEYDVGEPPDP